MVGEVGEVVEVGGGLSLDNLHDLDNLANLIHPKSTILTCRMSGSRSMCVRTPLATD